MPLIAHIRMPEGGVLRCRMPEGKGAEGLALGDFCLCELDCGQDIGRIVKVEELSPDAAEPAFIVLRKRTAEDEEKARANADLALKAQQSFQLSLRYEKTPVKVLHSRFSLDRARLFLRYSAAVAVDLRRFISQIQRDYKTQVDLWQVGVRDEAALAGCTGICGRVACCCAWQRQCPNLNTRMAREQDVTLNPITANGRCGRLKCCFAFEHEQYREAGQNLPGVGSIVRCTQEQKDVSGTVVARDMMRGRLIVRTREGQMLKLLKDKVTLVHAARPDDHAKGESHEDSVGEWAEP